MHAVWAYPALQGEITLVDNDKAGVDNTNLGRYVLFFPVSLGHAKATAAAAIAGRDGILWVPLDQGIEVVMPCKGEPEFVLSAVDTDIARAAIQLRYPARLLGASTSGLRAELLRAGPAGRGSCLACAGVAEPDSDEVVRSRLNSSNQALIEKGVAPSEVERVKAGNVKCGEIEARVLRAQRDIDTRGAAEEGQFAVSFVSLMAGTMLAAAAVKEALGASDYVHDEENRAVHQFFNCVAPSNRASFIVRRQGCSHCDPSSPATTIWARRQGEWSSTNEALPRPQPDSARTYG